MANASDAFGGASGTISALWTYALGDRTTLRQNGAGRCQVTGASVFSAAYWNNAPFVNDHISRYTIDLSIGGFVTSQTYLSVLARCSGIGGSFNAYQLTTDGSSGATHTIIQRWTNGVLSDLAAVATTFADTDLLELRTSGSATVNVDAYKNGVQVGTFADSSGGRLLSGAPGIGGFTSSSSINFINWVGGALADQAPAPAGWLRA